MHTFSGKNVLPPKLTELLRLCLGPTVLYTRDG